MALSKEELLKPRYQVIADYPNNDYFPVGYIYTPSKSGGGRIYCDEKSKKFSDFPHLFKPLSWWEERSIEDMPKFLRVGNNGVIREVQEYHLRIDEVIFVGGKRRKLKQYQPATREEYLIPPIYQQ